MTCSLAKFTTSAATWLAEEQINELLNLGNTALVQAALGLTGFGFAEVLASKTSAFNLLDQSKRRVLNEIQTDSGVDYVISLTLNTQEDLIDEIDELVEDLQTKVDGLKQSTQATPTYDDEKASIDTTIDNMKKLFSSVRKAEERPEDAADILGTLVTQGFITQESLDEYLKATPLLGRPSTLQRRQVVTELRERYYIVERTEDSAPIVRDVQSITPQFKIVDENDEEVTGISGYETGSLSEDGTITLTGSPDGTAQNVSKTLKIQPEQVEKRPTTDTPSLRIDISDVADTLEQELYFEVWACLILELVAYLRSSWDRISFKVKELLDILVAQDSILRGAPLGPAADALSNDSFKALSDIKNSLENLVPVGVSADELLAIQNSMATPGLGGNAGRSICDFNHQQYCNIHDRLLDFLDSLNSDLDLLNLSLGGISLGDIDFDLDALLDLLIPFLEDLKSEIDDVSELIDKLQGDICAFAANRMKGVPKSLAAIETAMTKIRDIISNAPSLDPIIYGISQSVIIADEIARLGKAGYTAAAAALAAGDLAAFFLMKERDATLSGQVAKCLEDAASACPDRTKASKLRELSVAARARSEQKITGERIRQGARQIRVLNNALDVARQIGIEGAVLIGECEADKLI